MTATKPGIAAVELLTIPEVAKRMGCSRQHVYNLINNGELEYINTASRKAGKTKKRISSDAIAEFATTRTRRAPRRRHRAGQSVSAA